MKILASLFVLFSISIAYGQTEKGNLLIGGSSDLGFGRVNSTFESDFDNYADPGRSFYLFIGPRVGYFLVDNWVVGLSLPASMSFSKNDQLKSRSLNLGLGPFSRYYFGSGILRPVVEGGVNLGFQNGKYTDQNDQITNSKDRSFVGSAGVGAAVILTQSVSLDGIIGYEHTRQGPVDSPDNLMLIGNRISFNIGIFVFF